MNLKSGMESFFSTGVCGITAEKLSNGRDNIEVVRSMLEGGIKVIRYQEKEKSMVEKYEECLILKDVIKQAGKAFIIDSFVGLTLAVDADGVYLTQQDLPVRVARKLVGKHKLVGLEVTNVDELVKANELQEYIDYLGVKSSNDEQREFLKYALQNSKMPIMVSGDINENNLDDLLKMGVKTLAIKEDIVSAKDITSKVSRLREKILLR